MLNPHQIRPLWYDYRSDNINQNIIAVIWWFDGERGLIVIRTQMETGNSRTKEGGCVLAWRIRFLWLISRYTFSIHPSHRLISKITKHGVKFKHARPHSGIKVSQISSTICLWTDCFIPCLSTHCIPRSRGCASSVRFPLAGEIMIVRCANMVSTATSSPFSEARLSVLMEGFVCPTPELDNLASCWFEISVSVLVNSSSAQRLFYSISSV